MKVRLYIWFLFVAGTLCVSMANAQEVRVTIMKQKNTDVKKFTSKKLMVLYLEKELSKLNADGYLEAYFDTTCVLDLNYTAQFYLGKRIRLGNVQVRGDGTEITVKQGTDLRPEFFKTQAEKKIKKAENNGYPFASVTFDSVSITDNKLDGLLRLNKGHYYAIDSLIIKGNVKIPKIYMQRYLGIKPGTPYSERMVREMDKRLKEIPFLNPVKPSEILFTKTQCFVYAYVKKRNASSFNGIIGVLPDVKTGKTTITGDARIILKNTMGKAETFDLNWRKIANQTQDLKISAGVPFLFSSPIGTEMYFKLFKRDTSFLEVTRNLGLTWQLNRGNFFKVFYNRYTSSILSKTIYTATTTNTLQNADVSINLYGIGLKMEKLDYRLNPRKGVLVNAEVSAGIKALEPNAVNDDLVYANEVLRTEYYNGSWQVETYVPIFKLFALKMANQTRFIVNQKIYQNESMRLGGIKTLRGCDEESIPTSAFSINTLEFRLLFEENSALFCFIDQAWYEFNAANKYVNDKPMGFGAGINFQVKTGVFSFTWALGKQFDNPVLFRNSKLHFGFINYF